MRDREEGLGTVGLKGGEAAPRQGEKQAKEEQTEQNRESRGEHKLGQTARGQDTGNV